MEPVLAIDVGTGKIRAVIGRMGKEGPRVIALSEAPSFGIEKGLVVDVESAARSMAAAALDAVGKAGLSFGSAYLTFSGGKISSLNSDGKVMIISADKVITAGDCQAAVDEAVRRAAIPHGCEVVQAIPIGFKVDDSGNSGNPVGLTADSLEASVHVIAAPSNAVANLEEAARRAGFGNVEFVFKPLASAWGILDEGERLNAAVIDVGGGTSGMAVLADGAAVKSCVFPVGGINITRDLSLGLKLQPDEAEEIKVEFGSAIGSSVDELDFIAVKGTSRDMEDRMISKRYVCQIIEARLEEIFKLARSEIEALPNGTIAPTAVFITGGSSKLSGIEELASRVFGLPAKTKGPRNIEGLDKNGLSPEFSGAVGALLYAIELRGNVNGAQALPMTATAELISKIKESFARLVSRQPGTRNCFAHFRGLQLLDFSFYSP